MLSIKNLKVNTQTGQPILQGISLEIKPGEVHVIMGPNGSGKSTLANVLVGRDDYQVIEGHIQFQDVDLLSLSPEARAAMGLFLAFQYPVEIPGVSNLSFLKTALNNLRKQRGENELDAFEFLSFVKEKAKLLNMSDEFLQRALNEGFSGGEKKRNEILQMLVFDPSLIILDEIDSGLDIDALQLISKTINETRKQFRDKAIVIITHYQRLLNYIEPDYVHILAKGKIVKSGGKALAEQLEIEGFAPFL